MRYALLRRRKQTMDEPAAPRPARPGRASSTVAEPTEQTVGAVLKLKFGAEYDEARLARELGCAAATAAELCNYWFPQGPPHLLERAVGVFANALNLDSQRLGDLLRPEGYAGGQQPQSSASQAPAVVVVRRAATQTPRNNGQAPAARAATVQKPRAPAPQKPRQQAKAPRTAQSAQQPAPAPQQQRPLPQVSAQSAPQSAPAASKSRPVEISIGTAEGIRLIKQSQPTITYRKSRKLVVQA